MVDWRHVAGLCIAIGRSAVCRVNARPDPAALLDGANAFTPLYCSARICLLGARRAAGRCALWRCRADRRGPPRRDKVAQGRALVVRLTRSTVPNRPALEAAARQRFPGTGPMLKLLRAYLSGAACDAPAGVQPASTETVGLCLLHVLFVPGLASVAAARLATMREVLIRRAAEPDLDMATVAAAVGIPVWRAINLSPAPASPLSRS